MAGLETSLRARPGHSRGRGKAAGHSPLRAPFAAVYGGSESRRERLVILRRLVEGGLGYFAFSALPCPAVSHCPSHAPPPAYGLPSQGALTLPTWPQPLPSSPPPRPKALKNPHPHCATPPPPSRMMRAVVHWRDIRWARCLRWESTAGHEFRPGGTVTCADPAHTPTLSHSLGSNIGDNLLSVYHRRIIRERRTEQTCT